MDNLSDRLLRCYSGAVYDVMRNMGHHSNNLHQSIRPINNQHKIAGKIFTIEGKINKTLDKHMSLFKMVRDAFYCAAQYRLGLSAQ